MSRNLYTLIAGSAALGCAVTAGVFFAFSTFVMPALARLAPNEGAEAMQSINLTVLRSGFMPLFFGAAVLCCGAAVLALAGPAPARVLALFGAATFLIGAIGVTLAANVPLNEQLRTAEGTMLIDAWSGFLNDWTFWNNLRTACATASAALLLLSMRVS